jgi:methionyl-tRNA formyltransferase
MEKAIVFAGTPANAAATLRSLVEQGFRIELVITRPDAPVGRKRVMTPSPVAQVANDLGIPLLKADRLGPTEIDGIKACGAELGVVVAYGALLRREALAALPLGWFNLHYSILPRWRGAAPVQRSIIAGDRETGVTLFKLDEGMDTGPIVSVAKTVIDAGETAADLLARLTALGSSVLGEAIPAIQAGIAPLTEQSGEATLAPKILRGEARIDWSRPAKALEWLIRGCNPEPGAFTELGGQPFKIHEAVAIADPTAKLTPGAVQTLDNRVLVGTGEGLLLLKAVQPASKRAMPAFEWARGINGETRFN